jgi:hypothetical protein
MNVYNILVDNHVVAENVQQCDLNHKIEIIRAYCDLEKDLWNSRITYVLNNTETIA